MPIPKVYIETSISSFYHEVRTEPDMVARRDWTREWWDQRRTAYDLVTSDAVLDELSRGDHPVKEHSLEMIRSLAVLEIGSETVEIVEAYIQNKVMPNDPVGDALHLALASYHKCDFLFNLELSAPGQREQFRSYPAHEHHLGIIRTGVGNAA